jgi:hypothetical protein
MARIVILEKYESQEGGFGYKFRGMNTTFYVKRYLKMELNEWKCIFLMKLNLLF